MKFEDLDTLLGQMGLNWHDGYEWRRALGDFLIALEVPPNNPGYLTVACATDEPRMEYSGNLGELLGMYCAVVLAIEAGVFGRQRDAYRTVANRG